MVTMSQELLPPREQTIGFARPLLWVALTLAAVGAVLAAVLAVNVLTEPDELAVGSPADTSYGSFTVTRAATTFVPATQGPPTMAKMMGTVGTDQLQVWVRVVNEENADGVRYGPQQMMLLTGGPGGIMEHPIQGSNLEPGVLPMGASVDGQVWFDLEGIDPERDHWLEYAAPDGSVLRIPLPDGAVADPPAHGHDGDH